jgi:CheY-like chemotaxis protein
VTTARLKLLGYSVLEAADGPTAMEIIEQHPELDLLFIDMVMPGGMSGAVLAEAARARRPRLALLVASGYAAPESLNDLPAGTAWLRKPYAAAELARTLRGLLDP